MSMWRDTVWGRFRWAGLRFLFVCLLLGVIVAVTQYSDDALTKNVEEVLPNYQDGSYGSAFHAAVLKPTRDQPLSGIVVLARGLHIIKLIDRQVTRFESVKGDAEDFVRSRPPTVHGRQELIGQPRAQAIFEGIE